MNCQQILSQAKDTLTTLNSHIIDVVDIKKPPNIEYAKQLAKVISKLSPLLGNMIEFSTVDLLNGFDWKEYGQWIRQDPGFPDALFQSEKIVPNPGIEIKAWFPFATEITARFKDSVNMFSENNIDVALIAWLPEYVIWGKPQIIDVLVVSGKSVAEARDRHYHNPPSYLVFEPEDTSERTANFQQTNTNGYKLQSNKDLDNALDVVKTWGTNGKEYSPSPEYQKLLKNLSNQFVYRLDTNYAKIDRIKHKEIEEFKTKVLNKEFKGKLIRDWGTILSCDNEKLLENELNSIL